MMKNVNMISSKTFCKSVLCAAMLSSLALPLQAAGISAPKDAKVDTINNTAVMLKLGYSDSALSDSLADKFKMKSVDDKYESKKAIAAKVASASLLLVNAKEFFGAEKHLNAYLEEAMKQKKLMVFENADESDATYTALPFMVKGDVVLFQPTKQDSDLITVYGGSSTTMSRKSSSGNGGEEKPLHQQYIDEMVEQSAQFNPAPESFNMMYEPVTIKAPKLSQLQGEELANAVATVTNKIVAVTTEQPEAKTTRVSGGSIGYSCPTEAKNEKLCWAAIVVSSPYNYANGENVMSILDHYSYGLYRTDQATTIAISPHGSANPQMQVDTTDKRAYYLTNVEATISPTSTTGMSLWNRKPANANGVTHVTSTSGLTYGIDLTVGDSPSLKGAISYSSTQSERTEITDWATTTSTNGTSAHWHYYLNAFADYTDWVNQEHWKKSTLKEVPPISKYGLQYTAEGIWVGSKDVSGNFTTNISGYVQNQRRYFTKNHGWGSSIWHTNWDNYAWSTSYYTLSLNTGWLKDL